MPAGGGAARAEQLATLTALRHRRLASDELVALLEAARDELARRAIPTASPRA